VGTAGSGGKDPLGGSPPTAPLTPGAPLRYRSGDVQGCRSGFEDTTGAPPEGSSRCSDHQQVVANLLVALHPFVNEHALGRLLPGPIDVLFGEGDFLEPDLVFVRGDRAHLVSRRGIEGAPDLVVEVLSPSTAHRDRGIKLERYRHFAVPEYWIVDLGGRCLEVWRLGDGADAPEVVGAGERLLWTPVEGGPPLDIAVDEVLAGA